MFLSYKLIYGDIFVLVLRKIKIIGNNIEIFSKHTVKQVIDNKKYF
jgi:hypothetical protein